MSSSRVRIDISRKYPISKISKDASDLVPGKVLQYSAQKPVVVDIIQVISAPLDSRSVFFKSLNKRTSAEHIIESFAYYGTLLLVRLPFNVNKKCNVGYGFVVFEDAGVAQYLLSSVQKLRINGKLIDLLPFSKKDFADRRENQSRSCDSESSVDAASNRCKMNNESSKAARDLPAKSLFTETSDDFACRGDKRIFAVFDHQHKPTCTNYHVNSAIQRLHKNWRVLDHSALNVRFRRGRTQKNNSRLSDFQHQSARTSRLQVL